MSKGPINVLIGTTKGAFILRGDSGRGGWSVDGPHCDCWPINHVIADPESGTIHIVAQKLVDASARLVDLSDDLMRAQVSRADHITNPLPASTHRHPRDVQIIPKSRDFH